jgi:hypothetical protein
VLADNKARLFFSSFRGSDFINWYLSSRRRVAGRLIVAKCMVPGFENGRNFSRFEPSVFLYFTRSFLYFRKNLETVRVVGRRFAESERKRDKHFSTHICGIPYLVGIFPYVFRILPGLGWEWKRVAFD